MRSFEYDRDKSHANQSKHGIDFVEARQLWEDPNLIEIEAKSTDESRNLVIGLIGTAVWSAVITYRNDAIRIISVRKARKAEVALYES